MKRLISPKVSTPEKNRKLYWLTPLLGLLLIAAVAITACGPAAGSEPPATPTSQLNPIAQATLTPQPTPEPPVVEEPAPIESVAIEVMAADPRQAELVVVSGLPNGCYTFKGHTMSRDGDTITVTVTNTRPDTPDLVCTEIYGMVTTRIPLTGDIEPCHTYTVIANGESHSAQAIGPHVSCSASSGPNDAEIRVGAGETVSIGDDGLMLTFLEVTEDSRCPSDALCVRAGQATVLLRFEKDGQELGEYRLSLGEGREDETVATIEGYTVKLVRLDPYPVSTSTTQPGEYVAYLNVSQG
jgi:hypothetical protein